MTGTTLSSYTRAFQRSVARKDPINLLVKTTLVLCNNRTEGTKMIAVELLRLLKKYDVESSYSLLITSLNELFSLKSCVELKKLMGFPL